LVWTLVENPLCAASTFTSACDTTAPLGWVTRAVMEAVWARSAEANSKQNMRLIANLQILYRDYIDSLPLSIETAST
jgi:hypothetical protein